MGIRLGAIADDYTGATDLGSVLTEQGLTVLQYNGVPETILHHEDYDVIIIALKSRSIPPAQAITVSLEALRVLMGCSPEQIYFKYCSTFDSTPRGNIGPVIAALMEALKVNVTIACPAFPANERSIYNGHLYVGDQLLSDSPLKDHPLNPMSDANLVRWLGHQTEVPVELINYNVVKQGREAIRMLLDSYTQPTIAVVDAIDDENLMEIGHGTTGLYLLTGASGLGFGVASTIQLETSPRQEWQAIKGARAVIAGSCSEMTLRQIEEVIPLWSSYRIDTARLDEADQVRIEIEAWIEKNMNSINPLLIYSSQAITDRKGGEEVSIAIEQLMGEVGVMLVAGGVRQLVIAGGETSGAVLKELGVRQLSIGPTIAPGVPWTNAIDTDIPISLALKSGNFGTTTFFEDAFNLINGGTD